jgi:hypothetical protein
MCFARAGEARSELIRIALRSSQDSAAQRPMERAQ